MTGPLRPCAVDLGSGKCGLVMTETTNGAPRVLFADALTVDRADTVQVMEAILSMLAAHGCDLLVLEVGSLFAMETPGATVAVGNALATCREIAGGLRLECKRLGIAVHQIARRSWSARLVPGVKGGVSNADAAAAAIAGLDAASLALLAGDGGQHKRDALGALRGWLLLDAGRTEKATRPAKAREPRQPKPRCARKPLEGAAFAARRAAQAKWMRDHYYPPKLCDCPKKHRRSCPLFVPLAVKRARLEEERGRREPVEAEPRTEPVEGAGDGATRALR